MFKQNEKADLCQKSLTGIRALFLLGLLVQAPRSFAEIKKAFLDLNIIDSNSSDDIIRIDINTLRTIGCDISRSTASTDFKYVLTKHPFGIKITLEEVNVLNKAYKVVKEGANIDTLLKYDLLFKKISSCVFESNIKEQLLGISALKYYKNEILEQLIEDCQKRNTLIIEYFDVQNGKNYQKRIIAEKIEMKNNKLYLVGFNLDRQESVMLPIKRINKILSRENNKKNIEDIKPLEVKFLLKNFNASGLEEGEKILKTCDDGSILMKGEYHNAFVAMQRMLSFGSVCTVLEPSEIRKSVVDKLLLMREVYANE